jgi:hypothetical protein
VGAPLGTGKHFEAEQDAATLSIIFMSENRPKSFCMCGGAKKATSSSRDGSPHARAFFQSFSSFSFFFFQFFPMAQKSLTVPPPDSVPVLAVNQSHAPKSSAPDITGYDASQAADHKSARITLLLMLPQHFSRQKLRGEVFPCRSASNSALEHSCLAMQEQLVRVFLQVLADHHAGASLV